MKAYHHSAVDMCDQIRLRKHSPRLTSTGAKLLRHSKSAYNWFNVKEFVLWSCVKETQLSSSVREDDEHNDEHDYDKGDEQLDELIMKVMMMSVSMMMTTMRNVLSIIMI